ncbi:hypothetical protein E1J38_007270 [Seonamhaeicola sediminis]|uniref:DUF4398 domain-containing protein n=1 Tax=Seonamhaeicola sediminis TaxID=2528206 RepID=A0A562YDR0_9FLAO|nr:hypothetical protein [Seonamhaeicola sediminis]TWO32659.1 hypothetical protein E1J38_007270 [Seonamhaeicola sediminis]
MKRTYTFLFSLFTFSFLFSQDYCLDADSNLIYAYSNVKDAYESNNLDHLKYYSKKSLKSFEKAKINLKECGCETAFNLVYDGAELLSKVKDQDTFEDGRFFVKRAKEITQKAIAALNKFTANNVNVSTNKTDDSNTLQLEKERLEQQRLELKQKEEVLAKKLAEQNAKALALKREKLIEKYDTAILKNIETYNELLELYGSSSKINSESANKNQLYSKSIEEIKDFYIEHIKSITNSYLAELNNI